MTGNAESLENTNDRKNIVWLLVFLLDLVTRSIVFVEASLLLYTDSRLYA